MFVELIPVFIENPEPAQDVIKFIIIVARNGISVFYSPVFIFSSRSETDSLQSRSKGVRVFSVCGQMKNETCLVEVTPEDRQQPISGCLRSRGCYVIYDAGAGTVFVWYGSKSTKLLKRCATLSARILRNR